MAVDAVFKYFVKSPIIRTVNDWKTPTSAGPVARSILKSGAWNDPASASFQRKVGPQQNVRIEIEQACASSHKRVAEEGHADAANGAARMIGMSGGLGSDRCENICVDGGMSGHETLHIHTQ
jgi:hypothetical protein